LPEAGGMTDALTGRTVAVPETRELDMFVRMLEERGARAIRCPLVAIVDAPDPAPVEAWLGRFAAGEHHDLVLMTGEGLRRLVGFAERDGRRDAFVARLAQVRKVTRGPKPERALRELGLRSDLAAATPTAAGVITALAGLELRGRTVGIQLYPDGALAPLYDAIAQAGARSDPVLPYAYASAADDRRVVELIERLASGEIDVIAFTSSPQLRRLVAVAEANGLMPRLRDGLTRSKVAAVGPVIASSLEELGVRVDVMPSGRFFLKPLVNAITELFSPSPRIAPTISGP
jgi:uroporphyrinogen-III synthase